MRNLDLSTSQHKGNSDSSKTQKNSKCSTTDKRNSYPYRRIYFEKNPGLLFGHIWFCSQCHKPIWSKKNVVVDHIVPLNKGGVNHHLNCVAICSKCNLHKSDIVDYRVAVGFTSKAIESSIQITKNITKKILQLGFFISKSILVAAGKMVKNLASQGIGGVSILIALFIIVIVIIFKYI